MIARFRQLSLLLLSCTVLPVMAQAPAGPIPNINLSIGQGKGTGDISSSLQIIFLLTILSLAPAIVMLVTSFARIIIVLGFTRSALGTQAIPPNSVLIGLAMFLTAFTMAPVWQDINTHALQPYIEHKIDYNTAVQRASLPVRDFLFRQTRESDLEMFVGMAKIPRPRTRADVPTYVLVPAFIISELKTAFTMGFFIFIPFVIIDLVVATVLMSMGMMMMPPVMISLPCKIMLFVLINGWSLIASGLVTSFH
ncbi:MAG: flagellar type III secretion system pore protein FliP [Armatimonadota bacterium]